MKVFKEQLYPHNSLIYHAMNILSTIMEVEVICLKTTMYTLIYDNKQETIFIVMFSLNFKHLSVNLH